MCYVDNVQCDVCEIENVTCIRVGDDSVMCASCANHYSSIVDDYRDDDLDNLDELMGEKERDMARANGYDMGEEDDIDPEFDYQEVLDGQPSEYDEWQDYMGGDDADSHPSNNDPDW